MIKLKICGVKSVDEAKLLRESGVNLVGLNFVPESPRCITLEQAKAIMAVFKDSPVETVTLFRNQPADIVNDYTERLGVDYVQLHGDESAEYARSIKKPVIKAIAVKPDAPADKLIEYIKNYPADYFVLDRHEQGRGDIINTGLAAQIVKMFPNKIYLAGGLNPDNLAEVLSKVNPFGIDIASGARTKDDSLDITKVIRCVDVIKSYNDRYGSD